MSSSSWVSGEKSRPIDASDLKSLEAARNEVARYRRVIAGLDPRLAKQADQFAPARKNVTITPAALSGHSIRSQKSKPLVVGIDEGRLLKSVQDKIYQKFNDLQAAFGGFDKNRNGTISKDECRMVLLRQGFQLTSDELEIIFLKFDRDNNGRVDYREFAGAISNPVVEELASADTAFASVQAKLAEASFELFSSMRTAFKSFDKDHSGTLSAQEMQHALKKCGFGFSQDEVDMFMKTFDKNRDGKFQYHEFVKALQNRR